MLLNKELIKYQDKLFWVYRKVKQGLVNESSIQDLKDFWMCDTILKQKTPQGEVFIFLREIPEAEIVS
jgi:hypothetical protein